MTLDTATGASLIAEQVSRSSSSIRRRVRRPRHLPAHLQLQPEAAHPNSDPAGPTYSPCGIRVAVTNKLPLGKTILADMRQIVVVRDVAPNVTVLSERDAECDRQAIRVMRDLRLL